MPLLDNQCYNDATPSLHTDLPNGDDALNPKVSQSYRRRGSSVRQNAADFILDEVERHPKISKSPRSSEDSDPGTEADDEKGRILKHISAPSVRERKGWRGSKSPSEYAPDISTPASTPPYERARRSERRAAKKTAEEAVDQLTREERYTRRRKGEIVRRTVEVLLWLFVGYLNCRHALWEEDGKRISSDFSRFFAVVMICHGVFPVRRTISSWRKDVQLSTAIRQGFHLPSRFDPGTLLYPVLLPLFVATAVDAQNKSMYMANMILGLSSVPQAVIPKLLGDPSYLHWTISSLPHISRGLTTEFDLLFPLHNVLTSVLHDLVTTSLDRSETFLLSTGLINLLLFGASPQAQILKALMWVGGFFLFLFCEDAARTEVALARVPSWRLMRNQPTKHGMVGRLNHVLEAVTPGRRRFTVLDDTSNDEDSVREVSPQIQLKRTAQSRDDNQPVHGMINIVEHVRSATARVFKYVVEIRAKHTTTAAATTHKPNSLVIRLTCVQAQALKYALALYMYTATIIIILIPVRWFVATRALHAADPFGWALGYLGGDWQALRSWVVNNNVDWWIRLPQHRAHMHAHLTHGWVDAYRQHVLGAAQTRLWLAGYCLSVIAAGIVAVLQLRSVVEVDTRRKVFHGVMVVMFLPTIPIDPCFVALALMVVLAIFLLLDLFRASQLPPISRPLTNFLAPYVDGRDHRGPVTVSPIFLLVGCAIPLWLSLACAPRAGVGAWAGWEVPSRSLDMVSGVICVGMGDAAASLIGRRYGRTRWYWGGGKSVEGSAAFVLVVTAGLIASWLWLAIGGWRAYSSGDVLSTVLKSLLAATGASLMESTLTAANDNVVVPIGLWLLVRGLHIE